MAPFRERASHSAGQLTLDGYNKLKQQLTDSWLD
jgi:hypothetical protein